MHMMFDIEQQRRGVLPRSFEFDVVGKLIKKFGAQHFFSALRSEDSVYQAGKVSLFHLDFNRNYEMR